MPLITNILVPVAFSPACGWAARYGISLAARFGASLTCLHVSGSNNEWDRLKEFVAQEAGEPAHSNLILKFGDPAECIVDYAVRHRTDLILMPTRACGRFRRFLLGSVAAKVLHDAHCPVLTGVHHEDAPFPVPKELHNLTCAIDTDSDCVSVAAWAAEVAQFLGAQLRLVHAVPAADETSDNAGEIEVRRYLFLRAREEFRRRFAARADLPEVEVRGGEAAKVAREAALANRSDLIVVGRGHTSDALGRLRTHTYSIIRTAPCPVVSL